MDIVIPPSLICPETCVGNGIIKAALGVLVALAAQRRLRRSASAEASPKMKTIPIALSPTRSRALNVFLGLVLSLVSVLFFLSLATYHPADPSMNTATSAEMSHAIRNWIGLLGPT